jgi:recombination protein RecT
MKDENEITMVTTPQQLAIKNLFARDEVKQKFQEMLGKRSTGFITSVLQIIASNHLLSTVDPPSVYHAAAVAATLDLPLNNNLGFAYIVPYNQKYQDEKGNWKKKPVAQFQMGYKGFIQLAQRTGMYRTLSAAPIYEGQLVEENPLTGFIFDFKQKKSDTVIGYASYFQLLNGFEKTLYVTVDEITKHGKEYSQTFRNGKGLWIEKFESMALKTVIKLNLSKWAPLSVDIQKAITLDQAVINNEDATDITYADNEEAPAANPEHDRMVLMIEQAQSVEELDRLGEHINPEQTELFNTKRTELKAQKK